MSLARNRVYELVRSEIISCSLMPGAEIRESELAQRLGVSKSPVRDAMQKLELEGLVDIEPRRGHRVRAISVKDAEDIIELRLILETETVKKVARIASDAELRDLDRFRTADQSSAARFTEYNRTFHHALSLLSQNRRLSDETRRLMDVYDRLCIVSLSMLSGKGGFDDPLRDHIAIIDALQERNGNAAARVMRRHVTKSRSQILRALEKRPIIG
jgi:DNA-binding GntR family transcriptional regulator